jgi:PEP-CTERM motif
MKKASISPALLALVLALSSPPIAQAQGTTYVSTLGLPPTGSSSVGSDSWLAEYFRTGTNGAGYLLDSVQLALTNASGSPSGFTVMISNNGTYPSGASPGTNLCTLNGSLNPIAGGIYTYSPASTLTLSPRTDYFIVLTAGTTVAGGAYQWSVSSTDAPTLTGGWAGGGLLLHSSDSLLWVPIPGTYPLFAISATPVPEPSTLGLLALGSSFLLWRRLKVKSVDTA